MKFIWKNNMRQLALAGVLLFVLCLFFPKLMGATPLEALRTLYGGTPLGRLIVQAGFFLAFSLLQYCGWLGLSCLLKNESNLLPRYQSRGTLFAVLWRFLLPTDLLFVSVLAAGTLAGFRGAILAGALLELTEISVRGFVECVFLSGVQLLFLVRLGEERTAMAMTALAVGMALLSLSPVRLIWLAPSKTQFLAVSLIVGIGFAVGAAVVGKQFYCKEEGIILWKSELNH